LIQWASETSVTRFFPSEYGTDIEYSPKSASEKPHQQKLKVRKYMATVKDLEWTYLVTGPYSDLYFGPTRTNPEVGSFEPKDKKATLLGDGKGRVSFTAMAEYV
jgi:NmrA-like family